MSSLRMYLPPFAADYAGALSALHDYDCVLALDNAMCCSTNYLTCDEPRPASARTCALFGTGIRSADAVFGTENKAAEQLEFALRRFGGRFAAVVGTPIPAMLGTDGPGIASRVEAAAGAPCLSIAATGYAAYDAGIAEALVALVDRFTAGHPGGIRSGVARVNVVGATPLDLGTQGIEGLIALLAAGGVEVGCVLGMGGDLEDVSHVGEAACNLAVSAAGVAVARHLQERLGTPWVACACAGAADAAYGLDRLAAVIGGEDPGDGIPASDGVLADCAPAAGAPVDCAPAADAPAAAANCGCGRVLVVHDQVVAGGVRRDLLAWEPGLQVDVASFFALVPELVRPGDRALRDECGLAELLTREPYVVIVGDPLLAAVPGVDPARLIALPHLAVSGRLSWRNDARLHSATNDVSNSAPGGGSDGGHPGIDEVVRRAVEIAAVTTTATGSVQNSRP